MILIPFLVGIAVAFIAAALLFASGLKHRHISRAVVLPAVLVGILISIVLGKLLYVVFHIYQAFLDHSWFRLNPEEFSFTGILIGVVLGVVLIAKLQKLSAAAVLDCFALPLCVLTAVLRFSEIFAGELGLSEMATFGLDEIADGSLLAFFPVAVRDSWGQWLPAVCTSEAFLAVLSAALVLRIRCLSDRGTVHLRHGQLFELAAYTLCAAGMFFETSKIVSVVFYYVHVEQFFCAVIMLILLIRLCAVPARRGSRSAWLPLILFLLCVAVNAFSQYFLDKAWQFYDLIPETVFVWISDHLGQFCYGVMFVTTLCALALYLIPFLHMSRSSVSTEHC